MLYLKEPDSKSMSDNKAACVPNACMPKVWKAKLIQGAAFVAVAHSVGSGAPSQEALSEAMVVMAETVRGAVLQGGTGVAMQTGMLSEKMTNSALSLMMVSFAEGFVKKLTGKIAEGWQDDHTAREGQQQKQQKY